MVNLGVADAVVSRYRSRGIPTEDLRQVAYMALVKAAQNFDSARGMRLPLLHGADDPGRGPPALPGPRVDGAPAAPRPGPAAPVATASAELARDTGSEPTPDQIAVHLGVAESDVREALGGEGCFTPASLDHPVGDGAPPAWATCSRTRTVAPPRPRPGRCSRPSYERLVARDRRILRLRFFEGLTQQEIAEDIGVTQMQVSRLLSRIYADLRRQLGRVPPGSLGELRVAANHRRIRYSRNVGVRLPGARIHDRARRLCLLLRRAQP